MAPDPKTRKLALQYLVAAYGADKLNDPGQAEPLVQEMIKIEPTETANYFVLAKIYEDAGHVRQDRGDADQGQGRAAERPRRLHAARRFYNDRASSTRRSAAHYERVKVEPNNPEGYYTIAIFYWDKVNKRLPAEGARQAEVPRPGAWRRPTRPSQLKPDYIDALVYKGLLLRSQALLEKEPAKQNALISEAKQLSERVDRADQEEGRRRGRQVTVGPRRTRYTSAQATWVHSDQVAFFLPRARAGPGAARPAPEHTQPGHDSCS